MNSKTGENIFLRKRHTVATSLSALVSPPPFLYIINNQQDVVVSIVRGEWTHEVDAPHFIQFQLQKEVSGHIILLRNVSCALAPIISHNVVVRIFKQGGPEKPLCNNDFVIFSNKMLSPFLKS